MASAFSGRSSRLGAMAAAMAAADAQKGTDARIAATIPQIDQRLLAGQDLSLAALGSGQDQAIGALNTGFDQGRQGYMGAMERFQPYAATGQAAFNQFADASGVNGAGGYDRATAAFRASPGYQQRVDQATDAVARRASSLGVLGSGNTMAAISDRAGDMADAEYGTYLSRLEGIGRTGYGATTSMAGLDKGLGDLGVAQGGTLASLYDQNAAQRAGIYGNTATRGAGYLADLTGMGIGALNNNAQLQGRAAQQGLQAGQDASANRLNFGMQAIGTGLSLAALPTGGGRTAGGDMMGWLRPRVGFNTRAA